MKDTVMLTVGKEIAEQPMKEVIETMSKEFGTGHLDLTLQEFLNEVMATTKVFPLLSSEAEDLLLHQRFKDIQEVVSVLKNKYYLPHIGAGDEKQEEDRDYEVCIGLFETWGYIDVYYLRCPGGGIYITEIAISDE